MLLPDDAQKLELAKSQGKISLSLRNPLDSVQSPTTGTITTEVLDPMISAGWPAPAADGPPTFPKPTWTIPRSGRN